MVMVLLQATNAKTDLDIESYEEVGAAVGVAWQNCKQTLTPNGALILTAD